MGRPVEVIIDIAHLTAGSPSYLFAPHSRRKMKVVDSRTTMETLQHMYDLQLPEGSFYGYMALPESDTRIPPVPGMYFDKDTLKLKFGSPDTEQVDDHDMVTDPDYPDNPPRVFLLYVPTDGEVERRRADAIARTERLIEQIAALPKDDPFGYNQMGPYVGTKLSPVYAAGGRGKKSRGKKSRKSTSRKATKWQAHLKRTIASMKRDKKASGSRVKVTLARAAKRASRTYKA